MASTTPNSTESLHTAEQKAAAFEWLRGHALSEELGAWYAGVLVREIAELKARLAPSETKAIVAPNQPCPTCGQKVRW